ncbi:MAG TPA: glucose 1-dehydrogenase [Candidatus Dormibacteraeota bacterium]|nr:glucose 1-dehydrogenase [Candidatus Dormibacteraeota bacterium]
MDLGLRGKVALVTAASKGIGRAVAEEFAREGADVAVCARGAEALDETVSVLRGHGVEAIGVQADVATAEGVTAVVDATVERFRRIDVLVNNAGEAYSGRMLETSDEQWASCLDINLYSAVRFTRAVVPHMRRQGGGRIVNISTVGAHSPIGGLVDYEAAKAALLTFSKTMAGELAADGILVNSVCPALIHTPLWDRLADGMIPAMGATREEVFEKLAIQFLPVGRFATPDEVSGLVVFLASSRATFITGVAYDVDGGCTRSIL